MHRNAVRRAARAAVPALLAAAAAAPLAGTVHGVGGTPYGDRLTVHPGPVRPVAEPAVRTDGAAVVARVAATGAPLWTYRRAGRRPADLLAVPGHAVALWDDGLITDTDRRTGAVRWHRAMPDAAAGAPWALDPGTRMLAVVTPARISAYRTADGDLRWTFPAPADCAFRPDGPLRVGGVLLVPRPCTDADLPWQEGIVAIDALGRVSPTRRPLANERPGDRRPAAGSAARP
ncbi:PQQ-binding-like beta-propeller repeat protein [Streptomyces sp. NRRL S-87]|uniref:outer membrane protein assembly factor BamB family protein n=1 Tax=Streptomyces sp. NRRL S-87 TaxID=1463920 RepID=UPI0006924F66|nr:PQQ-binding-like beta-propeller repeat protein [Streptomyces sp. NRRL S-87]